MLAAREAETDEAETDEGESGGLGDSLLPNYGTNRANAVASLARRKCSVGAVD